MAISWFPTTIGGFIVVMSLLLAFSWWLTGRIIRERDLITTLFRGMASFLVCVAIALFHYSSVNMMLHGPLADMVKTKAERDAPIKENMRQWVAAAAYDAYWSPPAADPRKPTQMSPSERKDLEAGQTNPEILAESALRGLIWMALEHRHSSTAGRKAYPHSERGTKVLSDFAPAQAQAMFDYIVIASPDAARAAQPFLADALAYCREPVVAAPPPAPSSEPAGKLVAERYPFIVMSRETLHGGAFVVRISATQTRVIEAASEEEALKIAKEK